MQMKETHPKSWFRAFFNMGLINYIEGNRRMLPCEAGLVNFFVDPYGEVYPCNGLEEIYWQESMGNIRNVTDFKEIWESEQAARVRELVRKCPKNCWMVGTASPVMKKYIQHRIDKGEFEIDVADLFTIFFIGGQMAVMNCNEENMDEKIEFLRGMLNKFKK